MPYKITNQLMTAATLAFMFMTFSPVNVGASDPADKDDCRAFLLSIKSKGLRDISYEMDPEMYFSTHFYGLIRTGEHSTNIGITVAMSGTAYKRIKTSGNKAVKISSGLYLDVYISRYSDQPFFDEVTLVAKNGVVRSVQASSYNSANHKISRKLEIRNIKYAPEQYPELSYIDSEFNINEASRSLLRGGLIQDD